MVPISVAICCHNAQATLPAALASVKWADETVVVDSGSTDRSVQIAEQHADRLIHEPFRGYSQQKQFAASLCRNDWVLILDSDEEVSEQLAAQLQSLKAEQLAHVDVVYTPRHHYVMARPTRAWRPDWQSRLIHRDRVSWTDHELHEDRRPSSPKRIMKLSGPLLHKRLGSPGWPDYFSGKRLDDRVLKVARQMHARGKRCHWWDLVLRPRVMFFKLFVLKAGFLDGTFGLLISQKSAWGVQLKYAALWAVQNGLDVPADQRDRSKLAHNGAWSEPPSKDGSRIT